MARYVLLRIEDDAQAADLLSDMAVWPDSALLTPCQENVVDATVVLLPGVATSRLTAMTGEIARSHAEYLAAPAAYAEED